ncbi:MAG: toprim domain-containing protein [Prevotella sp.]|nr:toprim domain-containing protein [Prevotella sp.]
MTIEEIRDMPITDFMHKLGCKYTKKRGKEVWFHAPYRSDRTPSFCVNTEKNIFNDFGAGIGGDIFTLAGLMINSTDFMAQARYIGEVTKNPIERSEPPRYEPEPAVPQFTDVEVRPLGHPALLAYLRERGIPSDIATANCVEIHYRLHDKQYFAIGFPNDDGGYEIRNRFFKGSIPPKAVSLIRYGSATVNVYDGFMDFLSRLTLGYGRTEDSLVLNSVANKEKAYRNLDGYEQIKCWLDNDKAGQQCLEALQKRFGEKVKDISVVFRPCKDVNEYLQQLTNKQQTKSKLKL